MLRPEGIWLFSAACLNRQIIDGRVLLFISEKFFIEQPNSEQYLVVLRL